MKLARCLYFDLPNPGALSPLWLPAFALAWWAFWLGQEQDSAFLHFYVPLLFCLEILSLANIAPLPQQDLASILVLGCALHHSPLFACVYIVLWSRVHQETLCAFACRVVLASGLTVVSTASGLVNLVPMSPQRVSLAWLQSKHADFAKMQSLTVEPLGGSGFIGETVRLRLSNGASQATYIYKTSLNGNLEVKCKMRAATHVYWREAFFYEVVTPKLREVEGASCWAGQSSSMLQIPEVLINEYDFVTGTSVLVMKDESAALTPGSEIVGASWQQAVSVAARYAKFHALHWSNSLDELDHSRHVHLGKLGCFDWMLGHQLVLQSLFNKTYPEVLLDAEMRKTVPFYESKVMLRMLQNLPALLQHLKRTRPFTLVHGDARTENMLFPPTAATAAGKMDYLIKPAEMEIDESYNAQRWLAIDFQTLTKSLGIFDLAYFVSLDLTFEDGCLDDAADRKLVAYYLDKLRENGVVAYGEEEAWRDYQTCIMLACLTPCVVMSTASIGSDNADRAQRTRAAMVKRCFACMQRCGAARAMDALLDQLLFANSDAVPRFVTHTIAASARASHTGPTAADDSFSHHTPQSVAALPIGSKRVLGSGRRDAYDRWFFNGYNEDGTVYFALACGFYPGRGVVDASVAICANGVQTNIRATRYSMAEDFGALSTVVGPIQIEVLEPLKRGRVRVKHEALECDLEFTARFDAILEPKFDMLLAGGKMKFDYSRLTQLVQWEGKMELLRSKRHFEVRKWYGTRDRSWGQRPHPQADRSKLGNQVFQFVSNLPAARKLLGESVQFYWLWTPLNLQRLGALALHSQETGDGTKTNCAFSLFDGAANGGPNPLAQRVEVQAKYLAGTRHMAYCDMTVRMEDGTALQVRCEPMFPFFMSGIGYGSAELGHAGKPPANANARVVFEEMSTVLADRNASQHFHIQEVCRLKAKRLASDGKTVVEEDVGVGILEQYVLGPHSPSAFRGFYGV